MKYYVRHSLWQSWKEMEISFILAVLHWEQRKLAKAGHEEWRSEILQQLCTRNSLQVLHIDSLVCSLWGLKSCSCGLWLTFLGKALRLSNNWFVLKMARGLFCYFIYLRLHNCSTPRNFQPQGSATWTGCGQWDSIHCLKWRGFVKICEFSPCVNTSTTPLV